MACVLPASGENREVVAPLMGDLTMGVKASTTSIHQRYSMGVVNGCGKALRTEFTQLILEPSNSSVKFERI